MLDCVLPLSGQTKYIFFSGKGGVGKSTMSCAVAVWLAQKGYKTLLVTTDPAPNLSDIFRQDIGAKVTSIPLVPNLSVIEIDPDVASEEYRERAIEPIKDFVDEEQLFQIKEKMKSPCIEEVAAFDKFIEFMDDPQFDVVVFDTAPTGHTIRLLELPSGWSKEIDRGGSTCIGPSSSLQEVQVKYNKAIAYLQDKQRTSFVFVLRPEKLSLLETIRSRNELSPLGISLSALIVNGLFPKEACSDNFFLKKLSSQQQYLREIFSEFDGISIKEFPLVATELNGIDLITSVGQFLLDGVELPSTIKESSVSYEHIPFSHNDIYDLITPSPNHKTKFVFITGKGGVGKSTIACITAVHLAEKGYKTLLVSTDPASHLESILGHPVGHEPKVIADLPLLFAARIDQKQALIDYKKRIMLAVDSLGEGVKASVLEELNSPCAEEMAAFECFMSYLVQGEYQIVVFDTAPTGHTLRLLELPTDWGGQVDLGSLTKASENTNRTYGDVIATMRDPQQCTFAFVMYPEYTPIVEAKRASEDLKAQVGIHTNLAIVNMLLPANVGENNFFQSRRQQQLRYMAMIQKTFAVPLLHVPLFDNEPEGINCLSQIGKSVFSESARLCNNCCK